MSAFLRKLGRLDRYDPASYKRFKHHPKSETSNILYRGDTRDPDLIEQGGGFFPQAGQRHGVSQEGASTGMVSLTLDPALRATYYSQVKAYYGSPTWGLTNKVSKQGYVYAVFIPTGRAIVNYAMAEAAGSKNVGSRELSTLVVPWVNVIGWRQLPKPETCKNTERAPKFVDFVGEYVANKDCTAKLQGISPEALEFFLGFQNFSDIVIYNTAAL
ncbi:MAG TPA: hypothetical protein VMU81_09650 [Acetobacteraceae bacterium]|jgi:hypothetical protein|nr:hypothetical protein [Acetobacteraceae bacterium]